jgi:hypothetical protein
MSTVTRRFGALASYGWIWMMCNTSYPVLRAQDHPNAWVALVFGFPHTLITWSLVERGSERAFGCLFKK